MNFQNDDTNQLLVKTPYGKGLITKIRNVNKSTKSSKTIKEVRLLDWGQTDIGNSRSGRLKGPMLYTTKDYNSVTPKKGDNVITPYGRGIIVETVRVRVREASQQHNTDENFKAEKVFIKYRISLTSWRLAGRSRVECFLASSQVRVVRNKTLREMNALERIDFAVVQKGLASKLFAEKKFNDALILYSQAVDAVRYIQHAHSTSNEYRADLLVVIVTCSNNAATCCIQLLKFEEAGRFAKNALILLNALYNKRGMKIHGVMMKDKKLSDAKIFGEWRGKSCLIIARSETNKDSINDAIGSLKKAKEYLTEFSIPGSTTPEQKQLKDMMKEVLKLKGSVIERRRRIREKEKARAQAMFSETSILPPKKSTKNISSNKIVNACKDKYKEASQSSEQKKTLNRQSRDVDPNLKEKKKVSFAQKLDKQHELGSKEDKNREAWYEEHKEALILLTIGGLVCLTTALGLQKRR